MAARKPSRRVKKAARKKSAGARKKKGSKKAARRKSERKKKAARRRAERDSESGPDRSRKPQARPRRKSGRAIAGARSNHRRAEASRDRSVASGPRPNLRKPERLGFIREDSGEGTLATIELERGELQAWDAIRIRGPVSDHYERVEDLMLDGKRVATARAGHVVTLRISHDVMANDAVFLLSL